MNKKLILICCLFLVVFITGCSTSKENVKLLNKNQVTRYAKSHFGKATYKEIESQTDDRIDYIFVDDEYNFEYKIYSYKKEIWFDGATGNYKEETGSDFGRKYYDYIIESLSGQVSELEKKYNVSIENNDGWKDIYFYIDAAGYYSGLKTTDCSSSQTAFYSIYSGDNEDKINAGNELASLVKAIDSRKYFKTCSIWTRENNLNSNGVYAITESISLD